MKDYTVAPARYAKGKLLVSIQATGDFKARAARLLGDGLRARWTNRERGYIASRRKVALFEQLYAAGWDAAVITGRLIPPGEL